MKRTVFVKRLWLLLIPLACLSGSAQVTHSAGEDPAGASRGVSSLQQVQAPPPVQAPSLEDQARRAAELYAQLQRDVLQLKEVSDKLQQALAASSKQQVSLEVMQLSKQAEQLAKRINAELKQH